MNRQGPASNMIFVLLSALFVLTHGRGPVSSACGTGGTAAETLGFWTSLGIQEDAGALAPSMQSQAFVSGAQCLCLRLCR